LEGIFYVSGFKLSWLLRCVAHLYSYFLMQLLSQRKDLPHDSPEVNHDLRANDLNYLPHANLAEAEDLAMINHSNKARFV